MMELSKQGISFLKHWEGSVKLQDRHVVYKDSADLPTIGYGHLLTKAELSSGKIIEFDYREKGLSEEQAESLFILDTSLTVYRLRGEVKEIEQPKFDALVSFTFNVGFNAFYNSTLLKVIRAEGVKEEVTKQFLRWVYSGGKKVQGLENRRRAEAKLYTEGLYI